MRKLNIIAMSVALLGVALPASAQDRSDRDRGGDERDYRDSDRDRDRAPVSQADLRAADSRLNQIYQRRITEARASDRGDRSRRERDWYGQEAALRQAERNWITYRDADCRYMAQPDVGERQYSNSLRSCLLQHTSDRIETLRRVRMNYSQR